MTARTSNSMHIINTLLLGVLSIILYLGYELLDSFHRDMVDYSGKTSKIESVQNQQSSDIKTLQDDVKSIKINYMSREEVEAKFLKKIK